MASSPSTTFTPSPELADRVLDAIADPRLSLADIAKSHSTTIEAITLWMTREDIRERLIATESAHAWRTRLVATAQLPKALSALTQILDDFQASRATDPGFAGSVPKPQDAPAPYPDSRPRTQDSGPAPHSPTSPSPNPLRLAILHHRRIETSRKSATTILRLTHFQPLPYNAAAVPRAYQPVRSTLDNTLSLPVAPTHHRPTQPAAQRPQRTPEPTPDQINALIAFLEHETPPNNPTPPAQPQSPLPSHPPSAIPNPPSPRFARTIPPLLPFSRPPSIAGRLAQAAGAPASPRAP